MQRVYCIWDLGSIWGDLPRWEWRASSTETHSQ